MKSIFYGSFVVHGIGAATFLTLAFLEQDANNIKTAILLSAVCAANSFLFAKAWLAE